jgi:hypothetical protein
MDIVWDGIPRADVLDEDAAKLRTRLANAAKSSDWPTLLKIVATNGELINSCRPGGRSLYAPLHKAAHGGAPEDIVRQLIELGAWRTLQNARGERAVDVAERKGHRWLSSALTPEFNHTVPVGVLLKIQWIFHGVIRERIDRQLPSHHLQLPELNLCSSLSVQGCGSRSRVCTAGSAIT